MVEWDPGVNVALEADSCRPKSPVDTDWISITVVRLWLMPLPLAVTCSVYVPDPVLVVVVSTRFAVVVFPDAIVIAVGFVRVTSAGVAPNQVEVNWIFELKPLIEDIERTSVEVDPAVIVTSAEDELKEKSCFGD